MDLKFDIKEKIEELVQKIQKNPDLAKNFQKEPVKTIEKLVGVDLPDEKLQPLVAGVTAKLGASGLGDKLEGLKKLF